MKGRSTGPLDPMNPFSRSISRNIDTWHKSLTVLATALVCAVAAAGPALAAPVQYETTSASTNLSDDGSPVTLLNVDIPAGKWLVFAKANAVNFSAADYVRCRILSDGTQVDVSATLVGDAEPGPSGEMGPSVAEVTLQTYVKLTATTSISLACSHDFAVSGEYVDPGASLMIVRFPD